MYLCDNEFFNQEKYVANLQIKVMAFDDRVFSKPIRIEQSWISKLASIDVAENEPISLRKRCNDTCVLKLPEQRTASKIAYIYDTTVDKHFVIDEAAFNELFEMLNIK